MKIPSRITIIKLCIVIYAGGVSQHNILGLLINLYMVVRKANIQDTHSQANCIKQTTAMFVPS